MNSVGLYLQNIEEGRFPNPRLTKQIRKLSSWGRARKANDDLGR